ncbi:GNAT family N-acetyltransferase [Paenibacillus sp. N1-5-1-14]|uniref:GNAT family N-acetyltransferase n=1 Tax=Paenibacillus radicibacter TaxID=2972488 RepID=UPI00215925CB|nr:GNAT family N-acetyltransferase [Paenibacillus radicibacter]MCR8644456.1 GNAT family N-acetyltransferase [Paenibacillus radicibacter]
MISLQKVDKNNWRACMKLEVKPEQVNFVASNMFSIAQVQFLENFEAKAIYDAETLVGFTMFGKDEDDGNYWIHRLMIDEAFQGMGYGKKAIELIMEEVRQKDDRTDVLLISYRPENDLARKLYAKVGFIEEGITEWSGGEVVARYHFS